MVWLASLAQGTTHFALRDYFDLDLTCLHSTQYLGPVTGVALCVSYDCILIGYKIYIAEYADPLKHPVAVAKNQ